MGGAFQRTPRLVTVNIFINSGGYITLTVVVNTLAVVVIHVLSHCIFYTGEFTV